MSAELYDIVFRGDILPGHQLVQVKQRLAQLFKADEARINALFVGGAVPLKRNLDKAAADKYQAVLRKAGADVQVAPAGSVTSKKPPQRKPRPAPQAPQAKPAASAKPQQTVETPAPKKPMTMQERLAAAEKELAEKEAKRQSAGAGDRAGEIVDPETGWSIAAVGSDVLKPEERPVVESVDVDVSDISLRESQGNLLDESERPVADIVEVDVSDMSMAEVGEDLLREDEKTNIPLPAVDVDDFGLAPVGSDMGQIKPPPPPPEPDTSGISLE